MRSGSRGWEKGGNIAIKDVSKQALTLEVRFWGALFAVVVLVFGVLLVQIEASYYDIHKENQLIMQKIEDKDEIISELEVIENELSSPKRILKIAKEQGLEYHEENLITIE